MAYSSVHKARLALITVCLQYLAFLTDQYRRGVRGVENKATL